MLYPETHSVPTVEPTVEHRLALTEFVHTRLRRTVPSTSHCAHHRHCTGGTLRDNHNHRKYQRHVCKSTCSLTTCNHMNEFRIKNQTRLKLGIGNHASTQSQQYHHHIKCTNAQLLHYSTTTCTAAKKKKIWSMRDRRMQYSGKVNTENHNHHMKLQTKWNHMNEICIKTQTRLKLGIGNHASPQSY